MIKEILKSKLFIWLAIPALLILVLFLGRQLYKSYTINKEIRDLEQEIAALEQNNQEVLELLNYLKTREYKERQARSLLSLQKPGEFAVALPPREEATGGAAGSEPETKQSNFVEWWNYFFKR